MDASKVPDSARVVELWTTIKTLLAGKVDVATLENYSTSDAVATAIASALEDYTNTKGIKELIATQLSNYMTAAEVNEAIMEAIKQSTTFDITVVDKLPDTGESHVIYLIPSNNPSEKDIKLEYIWIDGIGYEQIGSTTANLENYWNKDELKIMTAEELKEILV